MSTDVADLLARRAQHVSKEIQGLLHGLGAATQGAILADLVSLWLAGHIDERELSLPIESARPLTVAARAATLDSFIALVRALVPESEKEIMHRVEAEGSA